jgi:hypothetical protein
MNLASNPLADRLAALGYSARRLPALALCAHCGDQLGSAPLRISYELTRGDYTLYCESCGHTGDSLTDLRSAIERWNAYHNDMRTRKAKRIQQQHAQELYP